MLQVGDQQERLEERKRDKGFVRSPHGAETLQSPFKEIECGANPSLYATFGNSWRDDLGPSRP